MLSNCKKCKEPLVLKVVGYKDREDNTNTEFVVDVLFKCAYCDQHYAMPFDQNMCLEDVFDIHEPH